MTCRNCVGRNGTKYKNFTFSFILSTKTCEITHCVSTLYMLGLTTIGKLREVDVEVLLFEVFTV